VATILSSKWKDIHRELSITEKEEWAPICATEKKL
jgi:hypothetical protein